MTAPLRPPWTFDLCGGHVALDFSNTVSDRTTAAPIERLVAYDDLVSFGSQTGIVTKAAGRRLLTSARSDSTAAHEALSRARGLRDALYDVFAGLAEGEVPRLPDLKVIEAAWHRLDLDTGFRWTWRDGPDALDAMLGPIVEAGVLLLTTGPRERIRICEADDCAWVFLDTSKNRSRRWCDMKQCGNRAKARRFYRAHDHA